MTKQTTPFAEATDAQLEGIRGVCFDIDDTFSTEGQIREEAFSAMWALRRAGFSLVPVTGRPAGWCDHFARFWPVDAVVGENGAFVFYMADGARRRLDTPSGMDPAEAAVRLGELADAIRARFPHAKWASDQAYREFDLAIDITEDVPRWPDADVDELLAMCADAGAHAKLSSVHVNTWFGDVDKIRGFENWLGSAAGSAHAQDLDSWIYLGDSPNDEPMFGRFTNCIGVANVEPFLRRMKTPPRWMTAREAGAGFADAARRLVSLREQSRDSG